MDEPRAEQTRTGRADAVASLSSIAGAVAVIVYTVVATIRVLRTADNENPFGTIFFLILGAVVIFFLTAILVAGLARVVINLSRWLEPSRAREEKGEDEGH